METPFPPSLNGAASRRRALNFIVAIRNLAQGLQTRIVAFDGDRRIAEGEAGTVALAVKRLLETGCETQILIFDDATSQPVEIDFSGTDEDVREYLSMWAGRPTPGPKPRTREVELFERHWDWLDEQPGGASAALRRLVEAARKSPEDARRRATDAAYRFVLTMAGDRTGFEAATRALFAGDVVGFAAASEDWPADIRDRARTLLGRSS